MVIHFFSEWYKIHMSSIFAYIHFNPQTLSMHEHANTYIHACTCAYKHMHTHTNAHKHVHEHTNPHKRMHTHTHTHMQTRTHTYMHTHKHKLKEFDHKKNESTSYTLHALNHIETFLCPI